MTELPFFATKVRLGRSGVEEIYPLGPLNEFERLVKYIHTGSQHYSAVAFVVVVLVVVILIFHLCVLIE